MSQETIIPIVIVNVVGVIILGGLFASRKRKANDHLLSANTSLNKENVYAPPAPPPPPISHPSVDHVPRKSNNSKVQKGTQVIPSHVPALNYTKPDSQAVHAHALQKQRQTHEYWNKGIPERHAKLGRNIHYKNSVLPVGKAAVSVTDNKKNTARGNFSDEPQTSSHKNNVTHPTNPKTLTPQGNGDKSQPVTGDAHIPVNMTNEFFSRMNANFEFSEDDKNKMKEDDFQPLFDQLRTFEFMKNISHETDDKEILFKIAIKEKNDKDTLHENWVPLYATPLILSDASISSKKGHTETPCNYDALSTSLNLLEQERDKNDWLAISKIIYQMTPNDTVRQAYKNHNLQQSEEPNVEIAREALSTEISAIPFIYIAFFQELVDNKGDARLEQILEEYIQNLYATLILKAHDVYKMSDNEIQKELKTHREKGRQNGFNIELFLYPDGISDSDINDSNLLKLCYLETYVLYTIHVLGTLESNQKLVNKLNENLPILAGCSVRTPNAYRNALCEWARYFGQTLMDIGLL